MQQPELRVAVNKPQNDKDDQRDRPAEYDQFLARPGSQTGECLTPASDQGGGHSRLDQLRRSVRVAIR